MPLKGFIGQTARTENVYPVGRFQGLFVRRRQRNLTTSSVTRMIDRLEKNLGVVLLNRSTRQVTLTDAGGAYYLKSRDILSAMGNADESVSDQGKVPAGHLRISEPMALGHLVIAPHIGALLARYPLLALDTTLSDDIVDLPGECIDLSIRIGAPTAMEVVVSRLIGSVRRRVVASPST